MVPTTINVTRRIDCTVVFVTAPYDQSAEFHPYWPGKPGEVTFAGHTYDLDWSSDTSALGTLRQVDVDVTGPVWQVGETAELSEPLSYRDDAPEGLKVKVVGVTSHYGYDFLYSIELPDGSVEEVFDTILK